MTQKQMKEIEKQLEELVRSLTKEFNERKFHLNSMNNVWKDTIGGQRYKVNLLKIDLLLKQTESDLLFFRSIQNDEK